MYLNINGVKYHILVEGDGSPLLLLHGFTGSLVNWEECVEQWKKKYKLIRIDFLGHGKTDVPANAERYTMENTIADIIKILDELAIDQIHVLGYSMGGRVGLSLASVYPNRVKSLILESSSPGIHEEQARSKRREQDIALAEFIVSKGVDSFISYWESIPLFDSQRKLDSGKRKKLRLQRKNNSTIGLANSLKGIGTGVQPSRWNDLKKISIPVLLIVGELDKKFVEISEQMAIHLANVQSVKIDDAGHAIHVECPEIFGKIVLDWINGKS